LWGCDDGVATVTMTDGSKCDGRLRVVLTPRHRLSRFTEQCRISIRP